MSIAGPAGWKPPPPTVGLPSGPRSSVPFWSNTRMSGVNGLVNENVPPTMALSWSLHRLGRPWPDSSTHTVDLGDGLREQLQSSVHRPQGPRHRQTPSV